MNWKFTYILYVASTPVIIPLNGPSQLLYPTKNWSLYDQSYHKPHLILTESTSDESCNSDNKGESSDVELLIPTHRGLHKFIPRHIDEIGRIPFLENVLPIPKLFALFYPQKSTSGTLSMWKKRTKICGVKVNKIRWLLIGHYLPLGKKKQAILDYSLVR